MLVGQATSIFAECLEGGIEASLLATGLGKAEPTCLCSQILYPLGKKRGYGKEGNNHDNRDNGTRETGKYNFDSLQELPCPVRIVLARNNP
jgi:hypothetical protein